MLLQNISFTSFFTYVYEHKPKLNNTLYMLKIMTRYITAGPFKFKKVLQIVLLSVNFVSKKNHCFVKISTDY